MPSEPSHEAYLNQNRELIAMVNQLNQEYTELLDQSHALRKESRQLSEDSHILRRISIRLLWGENP